MNIELNFISLLNNQIQLTGNFQFEADDNKNFPYAYCNEKKLCFENLSPLALPSQKISYRFHLNILLTKISEAKIFFRISTQQKEDALKIGTFHKFCPITIKYRKAYYISNNWKLTTDGYHLFLKKCSPITHCISELAFLGELLYYKELKAIGIRLLYHLLNYFKKRKLWIIYDRITRADDNGEAFFQYMQENHRNSIKTLFLLSKNSSDYKRIKKIGKIVPFFTLREKMLFLLCDYKISSQADHYTTYPLGDSNFAYQDLLQHQKFVFLQHGVIKDDLSHWLNQYNRKIYGLITSAPAEKDSILSLPYEYKPEQIWLTGLPRHDRLYHNEKRMIVLMPTWRKYLMEEHYSITGVRQLKNDFENSQFYKTYDNLLSDSRLIELLRLSGYKLCVMPHPMMEPFLSRFPAYPHVTYFSSKQRYCDIFSWSNLIITDYSSAVFDFALLDKPILYFQFDSDMFFSGCHTFTKGYYNYEKQGFGEVVYTVDALISVLKDYIYNDCTIKPLYKKRIQIFFEFKDKENCKRVYEKIMTRE